jgi:hypothetical protein
VADENALIPVHPQGENHWSYLTRTLEATLSAALGDAPQARVQTPSGVVFVEWDPQAPLTPIGQLVFFVQFLEVCGHFESLCNACPVRLTSPNAPSARDVLGTLLLGILCGQQRYAHLSALRFDPVNPGLLAMSKVVSEDSARRYLAAMSDESSEQWLRGQLRECYGPLLLEPWVLDVDTTIKPIYGHQDAAKKGYNPAKPGRPSLAYHSYFIGTLRVCLDVEVEAGDQCAAKHGHAALWRLIDELPAAQRPALIRGDLAYGEEKLMSACEVRGQKYLFKLRQSPRVKDLIKLLEKRERGAWQDAGQGFEGIESRLQLKAWSRERRVIVLRRPIKRRAAKSDLPLLECAQVVLEASATHEFMVLITGLDLPILAIAQLYRDRADVENCFDELKNQWGWGGFTTKDLARSQTMARLVALVYNWWSLFVGLIEPSKHAEAITSRPQLLHGVARVTQSGRQTTISITSTHQRAAHIQERQSWVSRFLSKLKEAAEQLTRFDIWRLILSRVFVRFLKGRIIGSPLATPVHPLA